MMKNFGTFAHGDPIGEKGALGMNFEVVNPRDKKK